MKILNLINEIKLEWQKKIKEDEWYFSRIRENLKTELQPNKSFEAIPQFINEILNINDEYLCIEFLEITISLAQNSNTTEYPDKLLDKIDKLEFYLKKFNNNYLNNKIDELKEWYRI